MERLVEGHSGGSWPSPHCLAASSPVFASASPAGLSIPATSLSLIKIRYHSSCLLALLSALDPFYTGVSGKGVISRVVCNTNFTGYAYFIMLDRSHQELIFRHYVGDVYMVGK